MSVPGGGGGQDAHRPAQTESPQNMQRPSCPLGRGVAPEPGQAFHLLASADSLPGQMWRDFKGEEEPLSRGAGVDLLLPQDMKESGSGVQLYTACCCYP